MVLVVAMKDYLFINETSSSIVIVTERYWPNWLWVQLEFHFLTSLPPWFEKRQSWIAKIEAEFITHVSLVPSERVLHEYQNHLFCDDKISGLKSWLIEVFVSLDICNRSISKFSYETEEHRQLMQNTVVLCVLEIKLLVANDTPLSSSKTTSSISAIVLKSEGAILVVISDLLIKFLEYWHNFG